MTGTGNESINDWLKTKSSRPVSILVLIIAICCINAWQLLLPNLAHDNSYYIAAARNIFEGNGYTLASSSPQDLSVFHFEPLNLWPPGYSLLLVATKIITGTDWIYCTYILNAFGVTLLILALRQILIFLNIHGRIVNIYLLFAGSVPYPFLSGWFSDILAATTFMWALAILLRITVRKNHSSICSIASGFLFAFCAWLKYLFLPVSFVPFLIFFVYAFPYDKRQLLKPLFQGFAVLCISIVCLLWFQHQHSGKAFYINPTGRGFFPESLFHLAPVVPGSMLDFQLFDYQLSKIFQIPYLKMTLFWRILNVLVLSGLLFIIARFYRIRGIRLNKPIDLYLAVAVATSIVIVLELVVLSISYGPFRNRYTNYWTYVQELRYYAVVLLFIPQGILFLIYYRSNLLARTRIPFAILLLMIVVIQVTHSLYYLPKQVFVMKQTGKNRKSEQLDLLALNIAHQLKANGEKLVICSDSHEIANVAGLAGLPVLYEDTSLNRPLGSSKPVILLVILNKDVLSEYNHFMSTYQPKLLFSYQSKKDPHITNFYIVKFPGT